MGYHHPWQFVLTNQFLEGWEGFWRLLRWFWWILPAKTMLCVTLTSYAIHCHTWWLIPLSKWVITPVINGISRVNPLITGVITHLLSGMSHQVHCHTLPYIAKRRSPAALQDAPELLKSGPTCPGFGTLSGSGGHPDCDCDWGSGSTGIFSPAICQVRVLR